MTPISIDITLEPGASSEFIPQYETSGASGMDLKAFIKNSIILRPGDRILVPCGIRIKIPEGYEAQVRPRSGLAKKWGISLANTIGTVDSDFVGIIGCLLSNQGDEAYKINPGDRIAQMVICPVVRAQWNLVDNLETTDRGEGGFGSTGR